MTPQELKLSILKLAFSGELTQQNNSEEIDDEKAFALEEPPFDVPSKWKWNTLVNIADLYTGNSISETEKKNKYEGLKSGFDYIGTKDVNFDCSINYDNGVRIPFDNKFKRSFDGSILMCIEGGSAGRKIALVNHEICFGNKLCTFNSKTIFNKYLYYYLQSNEFRNLFHSDISGIIGGVSINKLKKILIPIPPLNEQKRIVNKIEELFLLVERYEKTWYKLETLNNKFPIDLEKSLLQLAVQGKLVQQIEDDGNSEDLFNSIQAEKQKMIMQGKIKKEKAQPLIKNDEIPFDIPKSWKWIRLGDCGIFERGSGIKRDETCNIGYPCVRYGQLYTTYKIRFSKTNSFIDEPLFNKSHKANAGDILMSLTGENNIDIALPVAYEGEKQIAIGGDMTKFTPIFTNYMYLVYAMKTTFFIRQKSLLATGQIIVHISNDKLSSLLIPLPPLNEQKRIVERIEEFLPLVEKIK